jgi:hypothetical protein
MTTFYFIATAGPFTPPPPPTGQYYGVNAMDTESYSSWEQPFLNLLKQAGSNYSTAWWTRKSGGTDTGEELWLQSLGALDSDGYATTLTVSGIPGGQQFTYLETWMNINIIADTPLPGAPSSGNALFPAMASTITYVLQFQGKCTLNLPNMTGLSSSTPGVSISGTQITSTNAWGTVNTVTFQCNNHSITLQITALPDSANYFKAASIVDQTYLANYNAGQILHPYFKAFLQGCGQAAKGFSRLRSMGGLQTNNQELTLMFSANVAQGATSATIATNGVNNGQSTTWPYPSGTYQVLFSTGDVRACTFNYGSASISWSGGLSSACLTTAPAASGRNCMAVAAHYTWATRPLPSWVTWGGNGVAIPYEVLIQACNEAGLDCWANIPIATLIVDSTFLPNLANLFFNGSTAYNGSPTTSNWPLASFTGLSSTQKVYTEVSNEASGLWNGGPGYFESGSALLLASTYYSAKGGGTIYTANGSNPGYASAEFYGILIGGVGQAFFSAYGSAAFNTRVVIGLMCQFGTGSGIGFLDAGMNTPNWATGAAYSVGRIGAWGFAPYCGLSDWFSAMQGSSDESYFFGLSAANQVTEVFSLMYTNVGNSGHTYSTLSSSGWVGQTIGVAAAMISGVSSQPWKNLPIHCYESGIDADVRGNIYSSAYLTQYRTMITSVLRDARIQYFYYDPTHQLSNNPGYCQAMLNMGIFLNQLNGIDPTQAVAEWGAWGLLEEIMQVPGIESGGLSVVPRYQGAMNFINGVTQLNWNPGYYLLDYIGGVAGHSQTYSGSNIQAEIGYAYAGAPTIKGYAFFGNWCLLEGGSSGTQGSYPDVANNGTSFFAQLMADATAKGMHIILQFNPGVFNGPQQAPNSASAIPNYILTNSTYGSAQTNGSYPAQSPYLYGWYLGGNTGYWANWVTNSAVYNALLAAIQNFATQWDGNANLEAFVMCADDAMGPATLNFSTYLTQLTNLMLAIKGMFKHTNVALQMAGAQSTLGQSYVETLVQAGVLVSRSDTFGATAYTDTAKSITFTAPPTGTSATLTSALAWPGGSYTCLLSTGQTVTMTQSTSSPYTAVTFSPAITGSPTVNATCSWAWPGAGPAMQAWAGQTSAFSSYVPPTPALQTYSTSIMFAEEGDFWDTITTPVFPQAHVTDMAAACNDSVTGGIGLHCSHLLLSYGNSSVWSARLSEAQSVALTNTGYPSVYL